MAIMHHMHAMHPHIIICMREPIKRGKEGIQSINERERNEEKVRKINNQSNKFAYLRRVLHSEDGVMGSNLEFVKRQVASCDRHCNFGLNHVLLI